LLPSSIVLFTMLPSFKDHRGHYQVSSNSSKRNMQKTLEGAFNQGGLLYQAHYSHPYRSRNHPLVMEAAQQPRRNTTGGSACMAGFTGRVEGGRCTSCLASVPKYSKPMGTFSITKPQCSHIKMPCKNLGDTSGLLAPHSDNADRPSITTLSTLIQVLAAFLIAGFGNVGAGLILDYVKEWPVFLHVDELFILVPSLLGLKGNLEMTMASRLSTQANLGHMDNGHKLLEMAKGNLALVQCQATVVSLSVAIFASVIKSITLHGAHGVVGASAGLNSIGSLAINAGGELDDQSLSKDSDATNLALATIGAGAATGEESVNGSSLSFLDGNLNASGHAVASATVPESSTMSSTNGNNNGLVSGTNGLNAGPVVLEHQGYRFDWDNALILCASSVLTANIACFVLGTMMILVIVGSHRVRIDPDNIASPVAASLGDMTTAALLAVIAHSIFHYSENQRLPYLALIITLLFVGMLPVWISVARTNPYTSDVITKGWTPIVIAVFISSCGGFILEYGKSRFSRLPVFQPVINGVGGNLVAVQASRLSTSLHRIGKPGELPTDFKLFTSPTEIFFSKRSDVNLTTARLLLLMSIPAHFLYFFVIRSLEGENSSPVSVIFLGFYITLAVLQVAVLLYLAQNLVNLLWRCKIDPDNYSTPILTATGDLLGCAFLLVVFVVAYQFNDPYAQTIV